MPQMKGKRITELKRIDVLRRLGSDQESLISELLAIDRKLGKSSEATQESLLDARRTGIALAKNYFRSLMAELSDPDASRTGGPL